MITDVEAFLRIRLRLAETGPFAAKCLAQITKGMTSARLGVSWPPVDLWISAPAAT
jgi:hypothetical protein